jgi:hypothetical protein
VQPRCTISEAQSRCADGERSHAVLRSSPGPQNAAAPETASGSLHSTNNSTLLHAVAGADSPCTRGILQAVPLLSSVSMHFPSCTFPEHASLAPPPRPLSSTNTIKQHILRTVTQAPSKDLSYQCADFDRLRVCILAIWLSEVLSHVPIVTHVHGSLRTTHQHGVVGLGRKAKPPTCGVVAWSTAPISNWELWVVGGDYPAQHSTAQHSLSSMTLRGHPC